MVDPNWVRWIHASIGKYLKDALDEIDIPSLVEGIEERTDDFQHQRNRAEIRVSGPFTHELNDGGYRVKVFVNVLVTSMFGGAKDDAYKLDRILGTLHSEMDAIIPLKHYGPDSGMGGIDDSVQFACLRTLKGKNDNIRVFHFGQIDSTNRQKQGAVDAGYEVTLYNN